MLERSAGSRAERPVSIGGVPVFERFAERKKGQDAPGVVVSLDAENHAVLRAAAPNPVTTAPDAVVSDMMTPAGAYAGRNRLIVGTLE